MPEPLRDIDTAKRNMLPVLLAEVRRVRRRRRVRAVAGVAAIVALAVVSALAWRSPVPSGRELAERGPRGANSPGDPVAQQPDLPSLAASTPRVRVESSTSTPSVRVEVVTSGSGRELFATDVSPSIRVAFINTDQAYALLDSTGQRYGIVEYAGRVEFVQLVAK